LDQPQSCNPENLVNPVSTHSRVAFGTILRIGWQAGGFPKYLTNHPRPEDRTPMLSA
jgi:hypothetical protein